MRYAIIANPRSGNMADVRKRSYLDKAARILGAPIHGLDTNTPDDLRECARRLAGRCDVLVVAGGDGTFSDIINAVDTSRVPLAFMPMGTANALRHALGYGADLIRAAWRIKEGRIHEYDLIACGPQNRAFTASIGFEGELIRLRDQYLTEGVTGFEAYLRATLRAYFKEYHRSDATITMDHETVTMKNLLSLLVVKQPYYGYGIKVVPKARFDDGNLHLMWITSGLVKSLMGAFTACTVGNRVGRYGTAREVSVRLKRSLVLQLDGNAAWGSDSFDFWVLPRALKLKC